MRLSVSRDVWTNCDTTGHFVPLASGSVLEVASVKMDFEMSAEDSNISVRRAVRFSADGGVTWGTPIQFGNIVTEPGWNHNRFYNLDAAQGPLFELGLHTSNVTGGGALHVARVTAEITLSREARGEETPIGLAYGPHFDDFLRDHTVTTSIGNNYGDTGFWQWAATGTATPSHVSPSASTEQGIFRVTTGATQWNGGRLASSAGSVWLAVGMEWAAKLKMSTGTSSYELASGLFTGAFTSMAVSDAVSFVGVRSLGDNLFGVVKDGSGSGNESTVDLGVNCEGVWVTAGFEVIDGPSIQFFLRTAGVRVNVGSPVSTNVPNATALGLGAITLRTSTNGARAADIDWWGLGGRVAR